MTSCNYFWMKRAALTALLTMPWVTGCGGPVEGTASEDGAATTSSADLALGARGEEVKRVFEYLQRYGYFENPALREQYPGWQPVVATTPEDPSYFDSAMDSGVRALQRLSGLKVSGRVDDATRELMASPRCAHPDVDPEQQDPTRKFAFLSAAWPRTNLNYQIINSTPDLPGQTVSNVFAAAFATWTANSPFTFTISTPGIADIRVHFMREPGCEAGKDACAQRPPFGNIRFDEDMQWTDGVIGAPHDLRTWALHEIGHALGLAHSSIRTATMYPLLNGRDHSLDRDDIVAINARYPSWQQLPGGALDIGVGPGGGAWVISDLPVGGGNAIFRWDEARGIFLRIPGGAKRITVGSGDRPWIANDAQTIYRRLGNGWEQLPGSAFDIGAGGNDVWIIGTNPVFGGFEIRRWNESIRNWTTVPGGGLTIAVEPGGAPWVTNTLGQIFKRNNTGTWTLMPGSARDIGIGSSGHVWVIGTIAVGGGRSVHVWNEQAADAAGAPAQQQWVQVAGGGSSIAVGPDGRPWLTNASNQIFRQRRD